MTRIVFAQEKIHPAIRQKIGGSYQDTIDQVLQAIEQHPVVVVGMAQNPFVKKVRRLLSDAGIDCHYLEYGSYFKQWRRRTAIKMLTGWQTFPQVFVGGQFVGGCSDVKQLLDSGEMKQLLSAQDSAANYSI